MKAKLLDADKVREAMWTARRKMSYGYEQSMYTPDGDLNMAMQVNLRVLAQEEAKRMIEKAFDSFVSALTMELEQCETDKYPCALCYEADDEKDASIRT